MRRFIPVLALLIISAWASTTPVRLQDLHDQTTLWTVTTQQVPWKPRPWINLADALNADGQYIDAIKALEIAKTVLSDAPLGPERKASYVYQINMELGTFARKSGHDDVASDYFAAAIHAEPWKIKFVDPR